jgi:hypothetical protein
MFRRFCFLMAVVLLAASGVFAANTGRLAGQVLDSDGAALPGVTVQISSAQLIGGPQVAIAGADGEFAFNLLPVGMYTVDATLPGFRPSSGEVRVQADSTASVTFRMVPESFGGEVEVTAEVPVVDTSQVNSRQIWDENYLQYATVGTANRSYQSVLGQAAGVTGGSNPNVFGSTLTENAYLIDGMNTTDTVTGTWATMFNIDAVQELNFQTGGFEAEFGQATGGIVNLVTKSGGNEFKGSFDARYRDESFTENGDHYDRDEQQESRKQVSATLGGPFLRDKLWFFTSMQYIDSSSQDEFANFPYEWEGWQALGKVTWQVADNHRLIAKYSTDPAEIPGINSSRFYAASARGTQEQGGDIWQLELNSVLSESLLLNAQVGAVSNYLNRFPTDNSDLIPGHTDEDTNIDYNNYYYNTYDDRPREEYRANLTWFVDNLVGSHEFKGGLEYSDLGFEQAFFFSGGAYVYDKVPAASPQWEPVDLNGDGYFNHYVTIKEPEETVRTPVEAGGEGFTFYVQDAWRILPNLTIKPGVRLDNIKLTNDPGEQIADMDRWQPRLGVAWDILGDARHVIRASGGRFMDPTALSIPSFASGVVETYHDYNTLEYYCNTSRGVWCDVDSVPGSFGDPIYWTAWNGQEYILFDNAGTPTIYDPAQTLDQAGLGTLKAPYAEEIIFAYETQIAPQTSIELSYVNKSTHDIIEDTCIGNTWAYGQGEFPDIEDRSTWTTGSQCDRYLITNWEGVFERKYEGYIASFETRKSWGHMLVSYTYSDSYGNNESDATWSYARGDADWFPVNFYNLGGQLSDHRDHRVKLNGYFMLPHRWTIGYDGFWSSPGHQSITSTCTAFRNAFGKRSTSDQISQLGIDPDTLSYCTSPDGVDLSTYDIYHFPRGYLETKSVWQLDIQVSKAWSVGGTVDLEAILTVQNIFGNEWDRSFNSTAFRQETAQDPETGEVRGLVYQNDDPNLPYYDEYYGADSSPVLVPIGAPRTWWDPRRYEIGFRIEF